MLAASAASRFRCPTSFIFSPLPACCRFSSLHASAYLVPTSPPVVPRCLCRLAAQNSYGKADFLLDTYSTPSFGQLDCTAKACSCSRRLEAHRPWESGVARPPPHPTLSSLRSAFARSPPPPLAGKDGSPDGETIANDTCQIGPDFPIRCDGSAFVAA